MGIPAKTKREWALEYLGFFPGQLKGAIDLLPDGVLFGEMARVGFYWQDPPGRWFQRMDVDDGNSDENEIMVYGDSPEGPFHWSIKRDGNVIGEGTTETAIEAIAAVHAALILEDFIRSEGSGNEEE